MFILIAPLLLAFYVDEDRIILAYRKIYKLLHSIAYRKLQDTHDAEDIIHDVFIAASKTKMEFNDDEHLFNWLAKVCAYRASSANYRKKYCEPDDNMEIYDDIDNVDVQDAALTNIILDSLLSTVPPEMRDPLQEHLLEDQKISVVCKKYGITRPKVKYWKKMFLEKVEVFFKNHVQNE